ncbi:MAG: tetratricopeptide repeat protein [Methanofollis sp.]|nr:tetratricopeptide repeat protein [Methanofollis sp.]
MDDELREFYYEGMAELQTGSYEEAIRYFEHIVAVSPDHRSVWMGLGQAWEGAGKMEEAEDAYARAQEIEVAPLPEKREREYVLPWHSPYLSLLPEDENEAEEFLQRLDGPSRTLQERYHQHRPVGVDYNNPLVQDAYMFRYFPFYIEILPHILENLPREVLDPVCQEGMKVALYGCGPAPELMGLILFLREAYPGVRHLGVTCYDQAGWERWQTRVAGQMAEDYWPGGSVAPVRFCPYNILRDPEVSASSAVLQTMQNCCTDLLAAGATFTEIKDKVLALMENALDGSLFILADVAGLEIKDLFDYIGKESAQMGEVLLWPVEGGERYECSFYIPENVREHLFQLYNRSANHFHSLVLLRRR